MKSKPIILAAILGLSLGGMAIASHFVNGGSAAETFFADDESLTPNVTATITSLPYTSLYQPRYRDMQSNELVLPLTYPGVYCGMTVSSFDGKTFNQGGHLFTATMSGSGGLMNWFSISTKAPAKEDELLYESEADYLSDNPLNVVDFKHLLGIDVYLGEGSVLLAKRTKDIGNYDQFQYSYDEENRIFSVRGILTGNVDPYRFTYGDFEGGDLLIVDKIVLHYNC